MSIQHKVLSIAGSDCSGGAGIQADLKTFSAFDCYGMTVITAITVQNTVGVRKCYEMTPQSIIEQLEAIFEDLPPQAIKIGMLFNKEIIEAVSDFLSKHAINIPIVLDTVMIAKSGCHLLLPEAVEALRTKIIPLASIVTPNIPEAESITGDKIISKHDMLESGKKILGLGAQAVLMKGGHLSSEMSEDIFVSCCGVVETLSAYRVNTRNTHGTGCTLSAAIAALLALGCSDIDACRRAKEYLTKALVMMRDVKFGHGHGPVHHFHSVHSIQE